ncbi:flagellar hook-associated protein [Cypionkella aquatica]|uniref:Flagellar hook-associated protein 1 n=1 Tax=Cypionkella aquatica TaxID=1756042 RepID=A0AA37TZG9_9RHOB|nr:flagellar hook-associated protein FlgK [Cypionkella aquatica]GLS85209.1 flagellar hook-associated protein [Cypionkella aquatica]
MSITAGLSSALSGLNAAARAAEIVSSNIANAMTDGYGRRELQLSARTVGSTGQGVSITSVVRHSDPIVLGDRRLAEAESGSSATTASFLKRLESVLGTVDSAVSLGSRINDFDTALLQASSRPESEARLSNVMQSAKALAAHIATAGADIQIVRSTADDQIENQVGQVNTALSRIADLNGQIRSNTGTGRDASALIDQRQQMIDSIAKIIPLREVPRDKGEVALITTGGAVLLDGLPVQLGFNPVGEVVADMTQASGGLSGLTLNGKPISTRAEGGPVSGGTLAAQFAIRDDLALQAQQKLDAVARDLIERFAASGLDATRTTGSAGLFTDAGAAFNFAAETGLAQRLSINAAADPAQGGALWRLRDGLGAATPGATGNSQLLNGLQAALTAQRVPASGGFMTGARSFAMLAADLVSGTATARVQMDSEATYASARLDTLKSMQMEQGVDTDQEMQSLLVIEQAYAANAKVIAAIGEMMQKLLEM